MADESELLTATSEIVSAYLAGGAKVEVADIPALIRSVRTTLAEDPAAVAPAVEEQPAKLTPAQIRRSITPDALISFVDGKRYKTLKRHLSTNGMTIDEYKAKYGLPSDYPTVAPNYSAARSAMAKSLGLGNRRAAAKPVSRPRKAKAS